MYSKFSFLDFFKEIFDFRKPKHLKYLALIKTKDLKKGEIDDFWSIESIPLYIIYIKKF